MEKKLISSKKEKLPLPNVFNPNLNEEEKIYHEREVEKLLKKEKAILVAHYYTEANLQNIAEKSGGMVGDSLDMARFCTLSEEQTIILAGVRFMGETIKILNPKKRILMLSPEATCSLDEGCPAEQFEDFCKNNQNRTIVAYINTSAAVKALADWVVTSRIAIPAINSLHQNGEKILWAPDKHMGSYVAQKTGADMVLWNGSCIVHDSFKATALKKLKELYPEAAVLAHPEAPLDVIELADVVGSTSDIVNAAVKMPNSIFIIATDRGILHKLKQLAPSKTFIEAPSGGVGATCKSCAHCPWMEMNQLRDLLNVFDNNQNEITIDPTILEKAKIPLLRMLDFKAN